jgi:Flp pilus assembly protein TadB
MVTRAGVAASVTPTCGAAPGVTPADVAAADRARSGLAVADLTEVRAALEAGAAPAAALGIVRTGPLLPVARQVRLGRPLAELAAGIDTGDPRADLLVRGLAVAERTGAGTAEAVEQVLRAADEAAGLARVLRTRTTQARGTAVTLALLPGAVWGLLVLLDPATLRFYATPIGAGTAVGALVLMGLARLVAGRILRVVERAPERADPLRPPAGPRDVRRAVALALPVGAVLLLGGGPALALLGALAAGALGLRREQGAAVDLAAGGTAETAELLAVAVSAGLPPAAAIDQVAALGPPAARDGLTAASRRLAAGWPLAEAFDGTRLEGIGTALDVTVRWGAPVAPALRRLAAEARADRRAAGEAAAERTQLALIFPTTLLTLPAFVLAVVPPVLWAAFGG